MIRVSIADDHQLFAEGLRDALDTLPDVRVVAVIGDAEAAIASFSEHPCDVTLVDLEMPAGGGMAVLAHRPRPPALVVSMHVTADTESAALEAGAAGVLSKSTPLNDLAASIRALAAGKALPRSPDERATLLTEYRSPDLDPGAKSLTEREIEVLQYLARGVSSTEELAEQLYISQKTVKNHLASIFHKLSVADRTQAAIEAIRLGLAKPK